MSLMHFIEQNARRRKNNSCHPDSHSIPAGGGNAPSPSLPPANETLPEKEEEKTENNSKKEENNVNNLVKSRITQHCCSAKCTLVNM